jgi:hypothetical protein
MINDQTILPQQRDLWLTVPFIAVLLRVLAILG